MNDDKRKQNPHKPDLEPMPKKEMEQFIRRAKRWLRRRGYGYLLEEEVS